ncbi:MAG: ABC transporter ATP-binding protein [Eubacteriales bacterium]|nr:ABC transporter ATP-binding protein [Eubacteriales bacterium]MDD3196811.1 ABC transporter ATP-binding protein [Eubacteriales bacterium]MDD3503052.1 ABC transporter ATP-binding protein [Eubacteriales bacterium]MDD4682537.1 ABC transporter ATP-binding protein [Eubacteriales bacterium]
MFDNIIKRPGISNKQQPTGVRDQGKLADSTGSSHVIEFIDINKSYGENKVLDDITFYIRDNEFITLLGPSGCGKTTTLRILAGFEQPDSGSVTFEGRDLLSVPPYLRKVNTVFQRYALFPHLNVRDNIAFGLNLKKLPAAETSSRIEQALKMVDLKGYENRWVDQLSGGQMQRIAIARAIVNKPQILLLDEPLGALDLKMRKEMQLELKEMQKTLGITFVYVTHDQEEALTMSDTIIVMKQGKIQQIGTPVDIYNEPRNAFVADFIGESNIIPGRMKQDYEVDFCGNSFICVDKRFADEEVDVVIRPEDIQIVAPEGRALSGHVSSIVFKGVHYEMSIETENFSFLVHSTDKAEQGSLVGLHFDPDEIHVMAKSAFSPDIYKTDENGDDSTNYEEGSW